MWDVSLSSLRARQTHRCTDALQNADALQTVVKEKAPRAPIKTIPQFFRRRNFGKVLVGIRVMTQWQSHSWELAI